jgi:hypothetical protein
MIKTEALCLTKFMNHSDMKEWLEWHLDSVGFDHIHVINNDSKFDLESLCSSFKDKVSYEEVHRYPRQYLIYNEYVNNGSTSDWIMPIDDDEYLELSREFLSVKDAIAFYKEQFPDMEMLAVRWKHLFPLRFKAERTGKVLDYCVREDHLLARKFHSMGDRGVKTIVHRSGKICYREKQEALNGGHVPLHEKADSAYLFNGCRVTRNFLATIPSDMENEKIRLLHCRYKGYSDYKQKMQEVVKISGSTPREKHFLFDDILETLE